MYYIRRIHAVLISFNALLFREIAHTAPHSHNTQTKLTFFCPFKTSRAWVAKPFTTGFYCIFDNFGHFIFVQEKIVLNEPKVKKEIKLLLFISKRDENKQIISVCNKNFHFIVCIFVHDSRLMLLNSVCQGAIHHQLLLS